MSHAKPAGTEVSKLLDSLRADTEQLKRRSEKSPETLDQLLAELIPDLTTAIDALAQNVEPLAGREVSQKRKARFLAHRLTDCKHIKARGEALLYKAAALHRLFEAVAETSPYGIAVVDSEELRVKWANSAMCKMLDQPFCDQGILGLELGEFIPRAAEFGLLDACRQVAATHQSRFDPELRYDCFKRGTTFWRRTITPVDLDGRTDIILQFMDITEEVDARNKAAAFAAEHKKQRSILDHIMDSIPANLAVIDITGKITQTNKAWKEFALANGCREDLCGIGINYFDICRNASGAFSEGAEDALAGIENVIAGCIKSFDLEYPCHSPQSQRWFLLRAVPLADHLSGAVLAHIDITRNRLLQEALRQSEARFRSLVETTSDWIWEVDEKGVYTYVSPKVKDLLGYEVNEVLGKTPFDLMPPDESSRVKEDFKKFSIARQSYFQYENINIHRNGSEVVLETSGLPIMDEHGSLKGYRGIDRDITERKKAQRRVEQLSNELAQKNTELESILGIAAHDLRSMIVNITGFGNELVGSVADIRSALSEVGLPKGTCGILKNILETDMPASIAYIQTSSATIERILNGLLQIARVGMAVLEFKPIDMDQLFNEIARNVEFRLKETGVELAIEELPPAIGDANQIMQVFTNLIDNALKYLDPGRPGIIRVNGAARENHVEYIIEDNGKGIPPEYHKKIFDAFTQVSPESAKGQGLGLSIVKRIVTRHNGSIWVESKAGIGSRFHVRLPR